MSFKQVHIICLQALPVIILYCMLYMKNVYFGKKFNNLYRWYFRCELYEKTDTEYRELENIMAWLSTLGGAFSSLGDQTEHCVNTISS